MSLIQGTRYKSSAELESQIHAYTSYVQKHRDLVPPFNTSADEHRVLCVGMQTNMVRSAANQSPIGIASCGVNLNVAWIMSEPENTHIFR